MKLNELVQTYEGEVLFDIRETEKVRDDIQERPIVSFDRNERDAIKPEILERLVENYRVEVSPVNNVRGKNYSVTLVVVLGEAPTEGGNGDSGTDPIPTEPDTPAENV